jgi:hypothetical protein
MDVFCGMSERKDIPLGIVAVLVFVVAMDILFFYSLGSSVLTQGGLSTLLSFSQENLLVWFDVLFSLLSLGIIPYGFLKHKSFAWYFAMVYLCYALLRSLLSIWMVGDRNIGFLLFAGFVVCDLYLFTTSVKKYFTTITTAIVPVESAQEYTYGPYTLYTELVHLKNGRNQVIYFFSKHLPKSGTATTLPQGYHVEVSKRSGLPYLKKDPDAFPIAS